MTAGRDPREAVPDLPCGTQVLGVLGRTVPWKERGVWRLPDPPDHCAAQAGRPESPRLPWSTRSSSPRYFSELHHCLASGQVLGCHVGVSYTGFLKLCIFALCVLLHPKAVALPTLLNGHWFSNVAAHLESFKKYRCQCPTPRDVDWACLGCSLDNGIFKTPQVVLMCVGKSENLCFEGCSHQPLFGRLKISPDLELRSS